MLNIDLGGHQKDRAETAGAIAHAAGATTIIKSYNSYISISLLNLIRPLAVLEEGEWE